MHPKDPQISFREELHCDGLLSTGDVNARSHGFSISRVKYHYSAEITFVAFLGPELSHKTDDLLASPSLRFTSKYGDLALVAECLGLRSDATKLEGIVTKLDIGIAAVSEVPAKQTVKVQFTPTRLAQAEVRSLVHYSTGEIKALSDENERELMVLDTLFGRGTFSKSIGYEEAYAEDVRTNVQVPVPTLCIEVDESHRTVDVGSLAKAIAEYLVPFEALASFLSRRQVRWTEIDVTSEGYGDNGPISSARRLRSTFGSSEPDNPLIVPARLGERNLDEMLRSFLACPYRESVEHTVNYLNAHWGREFIESKLANAFIAFETLVNGIDSIDGSNATLAAPLFRDLRTKLESHIRQFSIDHRLNECTRMEMCRKLSELRRRPLVPRAVSLVSRYGVRWQDLWPGGANLERELSKAHARRNRFIHSGRIDDFGDAVVDADRLHTLTERLLYNLLGGKKEWLHPSAYPSRSWLQSS